MRYPLASNIYEARHGRIYEAMASNQLFVFQVQLGQLINPIYELIFQIVNWIY